MNKCDKSRKELNDWEGFESLMGLIFHGSDGFPHDGEGVYKNSVLHVQTCKDCKSWLKEKVPEEFNSRLAILKKYCCPVMYGAVESKGHDELHLRLIDFQGDPTWAVSNFDVVGGNLLIGYCPWCGSKMPKKSFVDDANKIR